MLLGRSLQENGDGQTKIKSQGLVHGKGRDNSGQQLRGLGHSLR